MIEITKQEAIIMRKYNNDVVISQTMKSKRHRGKYFLEESKQNMILLKEVKRELFCRKEKFSVKENNLKVND